MKQMNVLAKALYDNVAESPDELAFRKGDIVTVLEQNAGGLQGWWLCSLHGRQGVAPGNRLRLLVGCYEGGGTGGAGGGASAARQTCAANAGAERGGFRSQPQEDIYRVPPSPGSAQGLYRVPPSQGVYDVPPAAPGAGGGQAPYRVPPSLADDVYQVPPCSSSSVAAGGDGPHDGSQDVYQVPPSLAAQDVYQVPPSLEAPRGAQTVGGAGQRGGPQARLSPTRRGGRRGGHGRGRPADAGQESQRRWKWRRRQRRWARLVPGPRRGGEWRWGNSAAGPIGALRLEKPTDQITSLGAVKPRTLRMALDQCSDPPAGIDCDAQGSMRSSLARGIDGLLKPNWQRPLHSSLGCITGGRSSSARLPGVRNETSDTVPRERSRHKPKTERRTAAPPRRLLACPPTMSMTCPPHWGAPPPHGPTPGRARPPCTTTSSTTTATTTSSSSSTAFIYWHQGPAGSRNFRCTTCCPRVGGGAAVAAARTCTTRRRRWAAWCPPCPPWLSSSSSIISSSSSIIIIIRWRRWPLWMRPTMSLRPSGAAACSRRPPVPTDSVRQQHPTATRASRSSSCGISRRGTATTLTPPSRGAPRTTRCTTCRRSPGARGARPRRPRGRRGPSSPTRALAPRRPPPGQEIYDIPPGLQAPRSEPREAPAAVAPAAAAPAAADDAEEDVYDCPKPAVPASAGSARAGSSEPPVLHGGRAAAPDSRAAAVEASAEGPSASSASSASQDIYDVPREVYASVRKARSEAASSRDCEYDVPPAASRDAACAEPRSMAPGVGHQVAAAVGASVGRGGGTSSSACVDGASTAPARASKDVASPHSGSRQQQQRAAPVAYVGGAHGSSNGPAGPQRGGPVPLGNGLSHGGVVGHNGVGYGDGGPRRLPAGGADRPGGIQARPLPSPPPFPAVSCGDGDDSADGSCDPGSDEYDYVHLQAKDDPEPEKTSNGMGPIKDQIELIQVYRFEGGPTQPAAGCAGPLEALCRLPLCAHDRQLLRFYAEQGEAPLRALRSAAESFASRLRGGGGDDDPADGPEPGALTPRQLLAHGRAVVLGGHRLAFLADALARGALSAELRAATAALAEAVSERLRAVAASSKAAALRYPTAAGAGAWALRRETEARVGELLQQAHGFHELLTRLAGMATASGHSGP
ncbi:breast cancer anti-estrogen resistance protein 1 [Lampetra planeri]